MQSLLKLWPFGYFNRSAKMSPTPVGNGASSLFNALNIWESKLMTLQSILIWENKKFSMAAFFIYSAIFWILTLLNFSIVTKLSTIFLFLFITHEWVTLIWPEISIPREAEEDWTTLHPNIMSVNELSIYIENTYTRTRILLGKIALFRRKNPGIFCVINIVNFFLLLTIGTIIPGCVLLYLTITFLAAVPGLALHVAPPALVKSVYSFFCGYATVIAEDLNTSTQSDLQEFIPDTNAADISEILDVGLSAVDPDTSSLPRDRSSSDVSIANSEEDSFIPVTDKERVGRVAKGVVDDAESESDAQKFEDQLVAGLAARENAPEVEGSEDMQGGKVTWFNKALYLKIVEKYFNQQTSDDTNSGDSS